MVDAHASGACWSNSVEVQVLFRAPFTFQSNALALLFVFGDFAKMLSQFNRTQILIGTEKQQKLHLAHVAVFGIGGVGGYVVEALARAGVGRLDLIDHDKVSLTNLNRQIIALHSTLGKYKTDVMQQRVTDINPKIKVSEHKCFFSKDNVNDFNFTDYDYIVDAIDSVESKVELAVVAQEFNVPIISAMGAGNKFDAGAFKIADIYKTHDCPLAKVMRKLLKAHNIKKLKVVYSAERASKPLCLHENNEKKQTIGSMPYVPPVVGMLIAGEVIKDLTEK